ncbi:hypothetical protein PO883_28715 [Massilia sp. DJPM01]|uniref:hypothetical protein n=1 Tax=Massilia sp. DJPM01 TaxID=3024404 RepID=UPI00259DD501|nr:hypothetical protein [Massilia sp. DJPM01]MDM5181169.1 hypothetical protein [Massilia sp. DJPM01]
MLIAGRRSQREQTSTDENATAPSSSRYKLLAGAALFLLYSCASATSDAQARLDTFYDASAAVVQSDFPEHRKAAMVETIFSSLFKELGGAIPDEDLAPLFQATTSALFYTVDKKKLPLLDAIFRRMATLRIEFRL